MDQKMLEAARSGDVQLLHRLLVQNPTLLSDHSLNPSNENPLTTSIKANQLAFASEILMRNSQLALLQNQDGTWPLDVAAAYGNVKTVKEILMLTPNTCRLMGRDGRTAIHYAAVNGNIEIICELLSACSDCVKDVTVFGETALHLAVKYFKFEALKTMLQWLEKVDVMVDVVNSEDMDGNTILHYSASMKQFESLKLILEWSNITGNKLEVNATNKKGMTPLDILDILIDSSTDVHLRAILLNSGASSTSQFRVISESPEPGHGNHSVKDGPCLTGKPKKTDDLIELFKFKWDRDSPNEARGALLVVLALLAAITFQAGINPPDYLTNSRLKRGLTLHLVANTIALVTSATVIDYLMSGFPFRRETKVSLLAMAFGYGVAVGGIKPTDSTRTYLLYIAVATPILLRLLPYVARRIGRACC